MPQAAPHGGFAHLAVSPISGMAHAAPALLDDALEHPHLKQKVRRGQ